MLQATKQKKKSSTTAKFPWNVALERQQNQYFLVHNKIKSQINSRKQFVRFQTKRSKKKQQQFFSLNALGRKMERFHA